MRSPAATRSSPILLMVGLLLVGCTAKTGRAEPGTTYLPYRDLSPAPRQPQEIGPQEAGDAPAGTAVCTPAQVEVTVESADVPSQTALSSYRVWARHVRGPACALPAGQIRVTALDADGKDLGVASRPAGEQALYGTALLAPGATTGLFLSWRRTRCDSRLARFRLPLTADGPALTTARLPDPPCLTPQTPMTVRAWGRPFSAPVVAPTRGLPPWHVLTSEIFPPESGVVRVRLTNPTSGTVSLRPCPSYQLALFSDRADSLANVRRAGIDCAAAPAALAPGAFVDLGIDAPSGSDPAPAEPGSADGSLTFELEPYDLLTPPIAQSRLPVRLG